MKYTHIFIPSIIIAGFFTATIALADDGRPVIKSSWASIKKQIDTVTSNTLYVHTRINTGTIRVDSQNISITNVEFGLPPHDYRLATDEGLLPQVNDDKDDIRTGTQVVVTSQTINATALEGVLACSGSAGYFQGEACAPFKDPRVKKTETYNLSDSCGGRRCNIDSSTLNRICNIKNSNWVGFDDYVRDTVKVECDGTVTLHKWDNGKWNERIIRQPNSGNACQNNPVFAPFADKVTCYKWQ